MIKDHRQEYHRVWHLLTTPVRPNPAIVAIFREQLQGNAGPTLLLGVTPELADIGPGLVAVDRNAPMIANIWPGDSASRRAVLGEWLALDFPDGSFAACVGDGSLCSLRYPHEIVACIRQVIRVLRPGGRFVCRLYLAPDRPESLDDLQSAAAAGMIANVHAFKFRLGMALSAQRPEPQVIVDTVLDSFNAMFPDRQALAHMTGWPREQIDTIDFYRGSSIVHCFPTKERLLSLISDQFADVRLVPTGTYELSERCPLLVATTRAA